MKQKYEGLDMEEIKLRPLTPDDREQFVLDNQEAFSHGKLACERPLIICIA